MIGRDKAAAAALDAEPPRRREVEQPSHGMDGMHLLSLLPRFVPTAVLLAVLAGCSAAPAVVAPAESPGYGYTCYAGAYTCQLGTQYPVGSPCTCPGLGAPSYGSVR